MLNNNQDFIPPFCPNSECRFHHKHALDKKWFIRYSTYFSKKENKRLQRFMCLGCNKTFSKRTFAFDYCLKLDLMYDRLFTSLENRIDIAQWAQALGHSVSVIENRLKRLGRWLVCQGYLTARQVLRLKGCGLVRFGLFFRQIWVKASRPKHSNMVRCFIKQLGRINIVVAVDVWTLLSWQYSLTDKYFYRPAFTYH